MARFYINTVQEIRSALDTPIVSKHQQLTQIARNSFSNFSPIELSTFNEIINEVNDKPCLLDPIPSFFTKRKLS